MSSALMTLNTLCTSILHTSQLSTALSHCPLLLFQKECCQPACLRLKVTSAGSGVDDGCPNYLLSECLYVYNNECRIDLGRIPYSLRFCLLLAKSI